MYVTNIGEELTIFHTVPTATFRNKAKRKNNVGPGICPHFPARFDLSQTTEGRMVRLSGWKLRLCNCCLPKKLDSDYYLEL